MRRCGAVSLLLLAAACAFTPPQSKCAAKAPLRRRMPRVEYDVTAFGAELELGRFGVDAVAGFAGGAFGVVGTLITYETQRFHMKQRLLLERKEFKKGDDELESALDSIGIAALVDDIIKENLTPQPADIERLSVMLQRRAESEARLAAKTTEAKAKGRR
ncbi:hypothetical protein M885DRAFT_565590 [Pelagophyceae sp. CCMP2097]|nr:hypothetical protein M885DRAFT_565590 [Pelagophyceae sp. CCMP2097]